MQPGRGAVATRCISCSRKRRPQPLDLTDQPVAVLLVQRAERHRGLAFFYFGELVFGRSIQLALLYSVEPLRSEPYEREHDAQLVVHLGAHKLDVEFGEKVPGLLTPLLQQLV